MHRRPVRLHLQAGTTAWPETTYYRIGAETTLCLKALYSLPFSIQRVVDNLDDWLVVAMFWPIFGARYMATVVASQAPPDERAPPILMRQLGINKAHILKTQTS